jgi:hypothetical protein
VTKTARSTPAIKQGVTPRVLIAKEAVMMPAPFIVAVEDAEVALANVIDPVLLDHKEKL